MAGNAREPRVAVVTPVYNGAPELGRSIESVRAQTYENWTLIVADNMSEDGSLDLARRYARTDPRIEVYEGDSFVPMLANWNRALRRIPRDAEYVKQINADDLLMPNCLAEMVAVAERNPSVSVVGAYRKEGRRIAAVDLPVEQEVVAGREVVRRALLGGPDYIGAPGSALFRANTAMRDGTFYDPGTWPPGESVGFPRWSVDKEPIYDLLEVGDFGFVHQLLTYVPDDMGGQTGLTLTMRAQIPGDIQLLLSRGPRFLSRVELRRQVARATHAYSWLLAKQAVKLRPWRDIDFRAYHHAATRALARTLRERGYRLAARELVAWSRLYAAGRTITSAAIPEPRSLPRS